MVLNVVYVSWLPYCMRCMNKNVYIVWKWLFFLQQILPLWKHHLNFSRILIIELLLQNRFHHLEPADWTWPIACQQRTGTNTMRERNRYQHHAKSNNLELQERGNEPDARHYGSFSRKLRHSSKLDFYQYWLLSVLFGRQTNFVVIMGMDCGLQQNRRRTKRIWYIGYILVGSKKMLSQHPSSM